MQNNSNTTSINFMEQWKPIGIAGSGSTCDVLLVQDNKTLETQVVKLFKPSVKPDMIEAEAELLLTLDHPRILSGKGYFPDVVVPVSETEGKHLRALALEWVPNGDLLNLIQSFGSFSEDIAKAYFLQLVDVLEYLHSKNICHLDIKPDNILVDQNYNLKLADLGVAMEVPKACTVKGKVGTAPYHSPEMHLDRAYNAYQADFFALAITLFTMVTGNMPFKNAKASDPLYRLIIEGKFEKFWAFHENLLTSNASLSKSFKSLMESMLAFEVSKRLSLEEMKDHAWVQGIPPSEEIIFTLITSVINKPNCSEEQMINTNVPCLNEGIVSAAC